jgi:hypothetical protein
MEISLRTEKLEKPAINYKLRGIQREICKDNFEKPWNGAVEHNDEEEKKTTREKVRFFEMKYLTASN